MWQDWLRSCTTVCDICKVISPPPRQLRLQALPGLRSSVLLHSCSMRPPLPRATAGSCECQAYVMGAGLDWANADAILSELVAPKELVGGPNPNGVGFPIWFPCDPKYFVEAGARCLDYNMYGPLPVRESRSRGCPLFVNSQGTFILRNPVTGTVGRTQAACCLQ